MRLCKMPVDIFVIRLGIIDLVNKIKISLSFLIKKKEREKPGSWVN